MTTVLLADPDADARELAAFKLRLDGYDVHECDHGRAVVAAVRDVGPDVVVLDIAMPRRSGVDLCADLRADAATARVPVLLLADRSRVDDLERGRAAGAADCAVKPCTPRELARRVRALVEHVPA